MFTFIMILFGTVIRILPHMANFAPVTATALFGGTYLKKRYTVIIPLITIALSDYLLLYIDPFTFPMMDLHKIYPVTAMFHSTTLYVWGSFIISGLIGLYLRKRKTIQSVIGASFICSLQLYVVTNFGVWATGMYSRGLDGLLQSYVMGLPFLKWTVLGDLFYIATFFGVYELGKVLSHKVVLKEPIC